MSPDALGQLLPIVLVVLLLFVMVIRPARRRAQRVSKLQSALSTGDEVMLSSGIFGTVVAVVDDRVHVTVADGVVLVVHRGAVSEIVHDVPETDPSEPEAVDSDPDPDPDPGTVTEGLDEDPADSSAPENSPRGAN